MSGRTYRAGVSILLALLLLAAPLLSACVDQSQPHAQEDAQDEIQASAQESAQEPRLIATSRAAVAIAELLDLDLVGVPSLEGLPERYDEAERVGSAMGPDMEIIASLKPTEVFGPDTLSESLLSGYEAAGISATFLNLRSVEGLYESIAYLGARYDRQELADAAVEQYEQTLAAFHEKRNGADGPRVLILMGLPGSYIECTQSSYVGDLVALAGGENVVLDDSEDFVSLNTEALLELDPDVILLTAHALPEQVREMFETEFAENDIWKHFRAVQNNQVHYLDETIFGMSATLRWDEGLEALYALFYGDAS